MKFTGTCEDLLWETGRNVLGPSMPGPTAKQPTAEQLDAYRIGHLSGEAGVDFERILAHAPDARIHMAELAEAETVLPDPRVRAAVLARFGTPAAAGRAARPRRGRLLILAAAVLTVALSASWWLRSPEPLPPNLAYDVHLEGLTARRGLAADVENAFGATSPRQVEAFPDTQIRITASPQPDAVSQVEFGLYRAVGPRLERLELGEGRSETRAGLEIVRGAAVVSARAGDLVPEGAARVALYLVAARPGDLPKRLEIGSATAEQVLEREGRRRAYPLAIRVLSASPQ